jgi:hypothetical protein
MREPICDCQDLQTSLATKVDFNGNGNNPCNDNCIKTCNLWHTVRKTRGAVPWSA